VLAIILCFLDLYGTHFSTAFLLQEVNFKIIITVILSFTLCRSNTYSYIKTQQEKLEIKKLSSHIEAGTTQNTALFVS